MVRPEGNSTVKAKELESIELDAISIDSSEFARASDHIFLTRIYWIRQKCCDRLRILRLSLKIYINIKCRYSYYLDNTKLTNRIRQWLDFSPYKEIYTM